ncbi:MAG: hypothetical protein R3D29_11905 [Nitratireductor sp.]
MPEGNDVIELAGLGRTDGDGRRLSRQRCRSCQPRRRPLVANIIDVRMKEDGRRAIERNLILPVASEGAMIGVKPEFEDHVVGENSNASFQVISLDGGQRARIDLKGSDGPSTRLSAVQWYADGSYCAMKPVEVTAAIDGGSLDAKADGGCVFRPSRLGTYRLVIESPDAEGPATSVC